MTSKRDEKIYAARANVCGECGKWSVKLELIFAFKIESLKILFPSKQTFFLWQK